MTLFSISLHLIHNFFLSVVLFIFTYIEQTTKASMLQSKTSTFHSHMLALFLKCIRMITVTILSLWLFTLVVSRIYIFHSAYIHQLQTIEDERWLLRQCSDATFFSNLKQHVDLCTAVQENAKKNVILVSLNNAMTASSFCGTMSCWDIIVYIQTGGLSFIVTTALITMVTVIVVVPAVTTILRALSDLNYYKQCMNPCLEKGRHALYDNSMFETAFVYDNTANQEFTKKHI